MSRKNGNFLTDNFAPWCQPNNTISTTRISASTYSLLGEQRGRKLGLIGIYSIFVPQISRLYFARLSLIKLLFIPTLIVIFHALFIFDRAFEARIPNSIESIRATTTFYCIGVSKEVLANETIVDIRGKVRARITKLIAFTCCEEKR